MYSVNFIVWFVPKNATATSEMKKAFTPDARASEAIQAIQDVAHVGTECRVVF